MAARRSAAGSDAAHRYADALRRVAPRVTHVALVFNPQTAPFADLFWRPVEAAAPSFAVVPIWAGALTFAEFEHMVDAFAREPNGGLIVLPDVSTLLG
jgi:putative tryptophan/tyrosine transport system substrate-binding protein